MSLLRYEKRRAYASACGNSNSRILSVCNILRIVAGEAESPVRKIASTCPCSNAVRARQPLQRLRAAVEDQQGLIKQPADSTIFSLMPLRASILLYRWAIVSKLLPFGPLLMVSVCGGAELKKCSVAQTSAPHKSTAGPTVWTKAHQDTLVVFDGINRDSLLFKSIAGLLAP